ncbi:MAG: hypothetical protein OSA98_06580 [Rubripirellula sp.]|nr:hypothetical protein [Rubripirellula sp.]
MDRQSLKAAFTALSVLAVFSAAIFLRLPSCYESLWVDELHSAWIVAGDFSRVYQRSVIGHQSPCYFFLLWIWKQAFGDSEMLLRLSSVLLVACGCAVTTLGVIRWTKSLLAGLTAGFILAIENNSLFFGTELRPFALVILFASIAAITFLRLSSTESRHQKPATWCLLVVSILLSALAQPTCLGVLVWIPLGLGGIWWFRNPKQFFRCSVMDGVLLTTVILTLITLWQITLGNSWAEKSMWGSFAKATHWLQIGNMWDWTWLLVIPAIPVLLTLAFQKLRKRQIRDEAILIGLGSLALLAVLTTSTYWILSRIEIAPVWHRRYLVAVLPLLACFSGGCLGYLDRSISHRLPGATFAWVMAATIVMGIGIHQRTLSRLHHYPVALVKRGEDWNNAVAWLQRESNTGSQILLDSGLIENKTWITPELFESRNDAKREYLLFPVRGLYRLNRDVIPVDSTLQPAIPLSGDQTSIYILTRDSPDRTRQRIRGGQVIGFGRVSIVIPAKQ